MDTRIIGAGVAAALIAAAVTTGAAFADAGTPSASPTPTVNTSASASPTADPTIIVDRIRVRTQETVHANNRTNRITVHVRTMLTPGGKHTGWTTVSVIREGQGTVQWTTSATRHITSAAFHTPALTPGKYQVEASYSEPNVVPSHIRKFVTLE